MREINSGERKLEARWFSKMYAYDVLGKLAAPRNLCVAKNAPIVISAI
jgi:hypothetical protein